MGCHISYIAANKVIIEQKLVFIIEMMLLNHPDFWRSFKKYFIRIAKYIYIVLVNIRNIIVKYFHCGPIQFVCMGQSSEA